MALLIYFTQFSKLKRTRTDSLLLKPYKAGNATSNRKRGHGHKGAFKVVIGDIRALIGTLDSPHIVQRAINSSLQSVRGPEGVLAHSQPDPALVILDALNPLLLRGLCVVWLGHQIPAAHADYVCGRRADGPAISAAARPDLDGTSAILPMGVLAGIDLDAVEFASVGGGKGDDVLLIMAAGCNFGAVGDTDLVPLIMDYGISHCVNDGRTLNNFILG